MPVLESVQCWTKDFCHWTHFFEITDDTKLGRTTTRWTDKLRSSEQARTMA